MNQYTMTREQLERMLAHMCRLIGDREEFSQERIRQWQTMYVPVVLANMGLK